MDPWVIICTRLGANCANLSKDCIFSEVLEHSSLAKTFVFYFSGFEHPENDSH